MKLVLSGLDTVDCAYYLAQGPDCGLDYEALYRAREGRRQSRDKDPITVSLGGLDFLLSPNGTKSGYPLMMSNADWRLQFGEFNNPSFYVNFRSQALWHKGAKQLHAEFLSWADRLGLVQQRDEGLSRVDFAFDVLLEAVDFDADDFLTLAAKDAQHRKDRRVQTFRFGEGDIVVRVYDKCAEIAEASQKTWLYDLWGGVKEGVWRVELQVRKDVLKRFGLRTFEDLFEGCGDLLRYLVREHTTLRLPNAIDSNRSRWPLHPLWALLQAEVERLSAQGVIREVDPDKPLLDQMLRLAVSVEGYLKRAAAIECVRRGGEILSHDHTLREFSQYLHRVHEPLTWREDVHKRADQTRLGQW